MSLTINRTGRRCQKVDASDAVRSQFLADKIVAGAGITRTIENVGGNEDISISLTPVIPPPPPDLTPANTVYLDINYVALAASGYKAYGDFQSAYDAANALQIANGGQVVILVGATLNVNTFGDVTLAADWNTGVRLVGLGFATSQLRDIIATNATNGFNVQIVMDQVSIRNITTSTTDTTGTYSSGHIDLESFSTAGVSGNLVTSCPVDGTISGYVNLFNIFSGGDTPFIDTTNAGTGRLSNNVTLTKCTWNGNITTGGSGGSTSGTAVVTATDCPSVGNILGVGNVSGSKVTMSRCGLRTGTKISVISNVANSGGCTVTLTDCASLGGLATSVDVSTALSGAHAGSMTLTRCNLHALVAGCQDSGGGGSITLIESTVTTIDVSRINGSTPATVLISRGSACGNITAPAALNSSFGTIIDVRDSTTGNISATGVGGSAYGGQIWLRNATTGSITIAGVTYPGYVNARNSRINGVLDQLNLASIFVNTVFWVADANVDCITNIIEDGTSFIDCQFYPRGVGQGINSSTAKTITAYNCFSARSISSNVTVVGGTITVDANLGPPIT